MRRSTLTAQLREQAALDDLTGLLNRRGWRDAVRGELARSRREGHPVSMLLLDLDAFKQVNDTMGHEEGDRVLTETAQRMRAHLRAVDVMARVGGDEFVVLIYGADPDDALAAVTRLCEATPDPRRFSAGFGVWDRDETRDQLLRRCDLALYAAKTGVASSAWRLHPTAGQALRHAHPRDRLHPGGHARQVRPGRRGRRRLGALPPGGEARAAVTDPHLAALGVPDRVRQRISRRGHRSGRSRPRRVEPTIDSLQEACDFALDAKVDGFVSVGGGSSIDTARWPT